MSTMNVMTGAEPSKIMIQEPKSVAVKPALTTAEPDGTVSAGQSVAKAEQAALEASAEKAA
jgi:hypothetical protein